MIKDKTAALHQILSYHDDWDDAIAYLLSSTEECDSIVASKPALILVLRKYVSGAISADDLEEWAGFIELTDDIDHSVIEDYLYALSNPELMGEITIDKALQMIELLSDLASAVAR